MNRATVADCSADTGLGTSFLDRQAKCTVMRQLARIRRGRLVIEENGQTVSFGERSSSLTACIRIHSPAAYRHILLGGSIGAGESYVDKLWDADDLTTVVRILVANMDVLESMEGGLALLRRPLEIIMHLLRRNNRSGAKKNILSHYDLGNDMYETFLDPTMTYSSAIYTHPKMSLAQAQLHKLEIICRKLDLRPGDHILEIGAGWGGFAIHAAGRYGCRVTTTTISDAQYREAKRRIAAAGLGDRINLLRLDYRDLRGRYDKLVSIEMIEAVGHDFLPEFFTAIGELLKPGGKMVLQGITIRDQQYKSYVRTVDFIQKHIFPGGSLPSTTRIIELLTSRTDMVVRHLEDIGLDYARTLADWRRRFNGAFASLKNRGYDERFSRLWNFYFCYCEGGFLERTISAVQIVADRPDTGRG